MSATLSRQDFQKAYGLLDDSWKSIAIGNFTEEQQWEMSIAISQRAALLPDRSAMLRISWGTAAAHLPTMVKAYILETNQALDDPSYTPCPLSGELPYKGILYQVYPSSYFYKWCQSSGQGVEDLLVCILDRVAKAKVEDFIKDFESISDHVVILTHLLAYIPNSPFPFPHLLPPASSPPSTHTQRLERTLGVLRRLEVMCRHPATAGMHQHLVAQHMERAVGAVLPFLSSRGKEPVEAIFSGEDWHVCAAGSLDVSMHLQAKQECGRCRSVWYCNPAHQKRHWNGTDLLERNYPHKAHCFENDL